MASYMPHLLLKVWVCVKPSTCLWHLLASYVSVRMNPMHHSHLCLCLSNVTHNSLYAFTSVFSELAQQAIKDGKSPVIIDNTNLEKWEMEPYAEMVSDTIIVST